MNNVVLEETEQGDFPIDIYTRLANDRVLFINEFIDDKVATEISATLLLKDSENSDAKISLFINSNGGDIRNIFMLYDTMSLLNCQIETIGVGQVFNEAVLLLAAGTPGLRYVTPSTTMQVSQLIANEGYYSSLIGANSWMERFQRDNKSFMSMLAKHTGTTYKQCLSTFEKTKFLNPKQAMQHGLIDAILTKK